MRSALAEFLGWRKHGYTDTRALGDCLQSLIEEGLDQLPSPASEQILERWQALSVVDGGDPVEHAAHKVISHSRPAPSAGPYCKDRQSARPTAELPVLSRQSYAERDLAALGNLTPNAAFQAPSGMGQL
jgi:hypothetical protein